LKASQCIKAPSRRGGKAISVARYLGIFQEDLKPISRGEYVLVPISRQPSEPELNAIRSQLVEANFEAAEFPERRRTAGSLLTLLQDSLPPHLLACLPRSIDQVGDIAVIEVPEELSGFKKMIGEAVLKLNRNMHTVLAKASPVSGKCRIRKFEIIAGKGETATIHREHGCRYRVDLAKVYFSPRLGYEHSRVASQVTEGEVVVDMFSGVGAFSIMIARKVGNVKVYAIDINPETIKLLEENLALNRVQGKVHPTLGDSREVIGKSLVGVADRVIMNLPEESKRFVESACKSIKREGGILHYYTFTAEPDSLGKARSELTRAVKDAGREVGEVTSTRSVKPSAPHEWLVVVDAKVY